MSDTKQKKRAIIFRLFALIAAGLIVWAYFSPIWWVSLNAPQYPPSAYPDGVRIHFHMDAVKNGCVPTELDILYGDEPLDCVEEMNVINHFIGMYPMDEGAEIEMALAPYLFSITVLMIFIFMFYKGRGWWMLAVPGIAIPPVFIIDFSAWMWWFGHNLQDWGAFTIKPFMPTVFGEGKVAQFGTSAYPHDGFYMLVAASVLLLLAVTIRKKYLRDENK